MDDVTTHINFSMINVVFTGLSLSSNKQCFHDKIYTYKHISSQHDYSFMIFPSRLASISVYISHMLFLELLRTAMNVEAA